MIETKNLTDDQFDALTYEEKKEITIANLNELKQRINSCFSKIFQEKKAFLKDRSNSYGFFFVVGNLEFCIDYFLNDDVFSVKRLLWFNGVEFREDQNNVFSEVFDLIFFLEQNINALN